jgi:hypothetical protein
MVTRTLGRAPLAWQFRVLGWCFLGGVAVLLISVVAIIGSGIYYEATRTKAGEVESLIERELPRGAAPEQMFSFLDAQGIEHGPVEQMDPADPALKDFGLPASTRTITAVLRNDGYSLSLVDIEITFVLDDRGLFWDYVVREVRG